MMNSEHWKPVDGFPGYEVSSHGNVRSLKRYGGSDTRLLSTHIVRNGYVHVGLQQNGKRVALLVHRLVAQAFLPPPSPEQTDVCHNDGDRTNNHVDNLRWDTRAGNVADKKRHGTHLAGEHHPSAKLSADDVRRIRATYKGRGNGPSQASLAAMFGCTKAHVSDIVNKKSWKD